MVDATLSTDDSAMGRLTPEDVSFESRGPLSNFANHLVPFVLAWFLV